MEPAPSNGPREPSPSETPLVLYCQKGHKDAHGNPLPYSILGERTAHKKINGVWVDVVEPIYECIECVFPHEFDESEL